MRGNSGAARPRKASSRSASRASKRTYRLSSWKRVSCIRALRLYRRSCADGPDFGRQARRAKIGRLQGVEECFLELRIIDGLGEQERSRAPEGGCLDEI